MWSLNGINGLTWRRTALYQVALAAALVLVARPALPEEPLRHGQGLLWQIDGTEAEAAWFRGLLQLALRLANTLNHLTPVFAEPARP